MSPDEPRDEEDAMTPGSRRRRLAAVLLLAAALAAPLAGCTERAPMLQPVAPVPSVG